MKSRQKDKYCLINRTFYDVNALSFSSSRNGYDSAWDSVFKDGFLDNDYSGLLDLGCGDGRFIKFFMNRFCRKDVMYFGIDQSLEMLKIARARFQSYSEVYLVNARITGDILSTIGRSCFFVAAVGLFHHIPDATERERIAEGICDLLGKGAGALISLWNFDKIPDQKKNRIPDKCRPRDFLLDWGKSDAMRFCHSFSEEEVFRIENIFRSKGCETDKVLIKRKNLSTDSFLRILKK
ncbi:class I SAM-dependent methyltransferase [candidate division WOR-3 bacterium]|nr:class I SAM-dependent methyltransferase [candidate division WOR-3 bacterium]